MSPGRRDAAILKLGQELSWPRNTSARSRPIVADTVRPTIAGAGNTPAGHARVRSPSGSPRRCCPTTISSWRTRCGRRGNCAVGCWRYAAKPSTPRHWSSSRAGAFPSTISPASTSGSALLVDGRWRWRSYSLTSSPVTGEPHHHHHRQGHARGVPVDPPGRRGGAWHDRPAGRAAGQLRDARSGAGLGVVRHRPAPASRR